MSSLNNSKGGGRQRSSLGLYEVTENSSNENISCQKCKCKGCGKFVSAKVLRLKRHLQKCKNSKLTAEGHSSDDDDGSLPPSKYICLFNSEQTIMNINNDLPNPSIPAYKQSSIVNQK